MCMHCISVCSQHLLVSMLHALHAPFWSVLTLPCSPSVPEGCKCTFLMGWIVHASFWADEGLIQRSILYFGQQVATCADFLFLMWKKQPFMKLIVFVPQLLKLWKKTWKTINQPITPALPSSDKCCDSAVITWMIFGPDLWWIWLCSRLVVFLPVQTLTEQKLEKLFILRILRHWFRTASSSQSFYGINFWNI